MQGFSRLITLTVALSASLYAGLLQAAPSVELKVTGVIRPAACTPTLAGSGVVDYGTIAAGALQRGRSTALPARQIGLTVACNAAAKIAVTFVDNRAASRVDGILDQLRSGAEYNFGLGSVAGKNVGGYALSFSSNATADARSVSAIASKDRGNSWSQDAGFLDHANTYFSFAENGAASPVALKVLSAQINVQPVLNKAEELPLTQDVPLDGSTTIEIKYL
ncbi:DUF1120 domain-containing protein [Herbaspirillum lusitanum]|uniref:DUF1120 domain-containing protein n=1 Tax=Herbaspirillum lusitanum TaxID=213312 RepID=A0ABW9ACK7_9BURK